MTSQIFGVTPSNTTLRSLVDTQDPLKTGLKYPFGKDGTLFSKSSSSALIRGQVLQLIFTTPGERVMLPSFGLYIRQYLFSPINSDIIEKIENDIYRQVRFYVNTAELLKVEVNEVEETNTSLPGLSIQLTLKGKETNEIIPMEVNL